MSQTLQAAVSIIVYIVLAPFAGAFLSGVDRKITARMQGRQGPPVMQPLYDVAKLLKKETKTVSQVQIVYLITFLIFIVFTGVLFFSGFDLLLIFFVLTTANVFLILAASNNNSPYATMGAHRETIQVLSYEPMVLLTAVGFYLATGSFKVREIVQSDGLLPIVYLPGIFFGFCFILTIKLRKHPFDFSTSHHAHQEIVKGLTTEFIGKMFAIVEIAHWYESILLLGLIALFFLNSDTKSIIIAIIITAITYFIEILVDNTNARLKWKNMIKSAWTVTIIAGALNIAILQVIQKGVW